MWQSFRLQYCGVLANPQFWWGKQNMKLVVVKFSTCILLDVCGDGKEYNLATKQCEFCSTGFHTVRPSTEKCVQCPVGFTTLFEGSNNCVKGRIL